MLHMLDGACSCQRRDLGLLFGDHENRTGHVLLHAAKYGAEGHLQLLGQHHVGRRARCLLLCQVQAALPGHPLQRARPVGCTAFGPLGKATGDVDSTAHAALDFHFQNAAEPAANAASCPSGHFAARLTALHPTAEVAIRFAGHSAAYSIAVSPSDLGRAERDHATRRAAACGYRV